MVGIDAWSWDRPLPFLASEFKKTGDPKIIWEAQFAMCNLALLMERFTRVGLEDNLHLDKGRLAKNSGEQVERIVRIARELGREPATPDETRHILNLKGEDKIRF